MCLIVTLKSLWVENLDNFIKNQCFEYREIKAVSGSMFDTKKDLKGREWHTMMGIYYLFEDCSHNILMKIRMTVLNSDDFHPSG